MSDVPHGCNNTNGIWLKTLKSETLQYFPSTYAPIQCTLVKRYTLLIKANDCTTWKIMQHRLCLWARPYHHLTAASSSRGSNVGVNTWLMEACSQPAEEPAVCLSVCLLAAPWNMVINETSQSPQAEHENTSKMEGYIFLLKFQNKIAVPEAALPLHWRRQSRRHLLQSCRQLKSSIL